MRCSIHVVLIQIKVASCCVHTCWPAFATFRLWMCSSCMRPQILAACALALALPVACSIDIRPGDVRHHLNLPVYPDARLVEFRRESEASLSFSGNFSKTSVVPWMFESDDSPETILDYYRKVLQGNGAVVECRGTINIHRRRGVETLECLEHPSARAVRLAGGGEGNHSIVVVSEYGEAARFAVLDVHTRG